MPPVVTRLSANSQVKKSSASPSIWDRVVDVTKLPPKGRTFVVYGETKRGKTRLFSTFPKPSLLIGTEDGTDTIKSVEGVKFVRISKASELDDLVREAATRGFKSICLDKGSGYQMLCLKDVLGLDDLPMTKSWGMATESQWGQCNLQFMEHVNELLRLSEISGTHIMIIAHERVFASKKGNDGSSDVISPKAGPALTPGACEWLNGAVNYICQCYVRPQVIKEDMGGVTADKKTGKFEYCLRTGPSEDYMSGFRLDHIEDGYNVPECIVNPSFSKIEALITGKVRNAAVKK